jgi:hypothetical protein
MVEKADHINKYYFQIDDNQIDESSDVHSIDYENCCYHKFRLIASLIKWSSFI